MAAFQSLVDSSPFQTAFIAGKLMRRSKVEVKGKVIKDEDDEDSLVLMVTDFKVRG